MDVDLSDHPLLRWTVLTTRLSTLSLSSAYFVERRLWKLLDNDKFRSEISLSALCQPAVWQGLHVDELAVL